MATANNKTPPILSTAKSYSDWVRLVKLWTKFTNLKEDQLGPALVMTLDGKDLEAVLELDDAAITDKDGVKNIISKLDKLHKVNDLLEKFSDLENFESFKRPKEMKIKDYLIEFTSRYNKLKRQKTELPKDLLGFKLLKAANLPDFKEDLIKATITEIDYDNIKEKLKSIFSNEYVSHEFDPFGIKVKAEAAYMTRNEEEDDSDTEEPVQDSTYTASYRRSNFKKFERRTQKSTQTIKNNKDFNTN